MARSIAELQNGTRIADFIQPGGSYQNFPLTAIESALKQVDKRKNITKRICRRMLSFVYYVYRPGLLHAVVIS